MVKNYGTIDRIIKHLQKKYSKITDSKKIIDY